MPLRLTHIEQLTVCVCYRNAYITSVMTTRVMATPPQKIHLSCAVLLSISLITVLERPRVFITSRTFLWASYNATEEWNVWYGSLSLYTSHVIQTQSYQTTLKECTTCHFLGILTFSTLNHIFVALCVSSDRFIVQQRSVFLLIANGGL